MLAHSDSGHAIQGRLWGVICTKHLIYESQTVLQGFACIISLRRQPPDL